MRRYRQFKYSETLFIIMRVHAGLDSWQGLGMFLFATASTTALKSTQPTIQWISEPTIQWISETLSSGVQRPRR